MKGEKKDERKREDGDERANDVKSEEKGWKKAEEGEKRE